MTLRARLTDIALIHDDCRFEIGAEVVAGVDLPLALFHARLDAGTAVPVGETGGISPELEAALAAYLNGLRALGADLPAIIAMAEREGVPGAVAFVGALSAFPVEFATPVDDRLQALIDLAALAMSQSPSTGGSPVPVADGAAPEPTRQADQDAGAPASAEGSSGDAASTDAPAGTPPVKRPRRKAGVDQVTGSAGL